jgi:hypothetical protein
VQKEFAGWYVSMSLNPDAVYVETRGKILDSLLKDVGTETLEILARTAFRVKLQMSSPEITDLRYRLTGDLTSPGDEEMIFLSAAALATAMQRDDHVAALSANLVATTTCGGLRSIDQPMDLVAMSKQALLSMSSAARRRPSLEFPKPLTSGLEKMEVSTATTQAAEGDYPAAIQSLTGSLNKVLTGLARRQLFIEEEFRKYAKVQDEELDILWWLQGGYSDDVNQAFADIPVEFRNLVIARELASLTTVLPGPRAITSLLTRAGAQQAPEQTIASAVQGMPVGWLETALRDIKPHRVSAATTPILFAIQRRKEVDGADSWIAAWSSLTNIEQGAALGPIKFAEAAYREFVFALLG